MSEKKPFDGVTVKEFPKIGKYRVRLVRSGKDGELENVLDIREYLETETYSGFTRRGIRIHDARDLTVLEETCRQVLQDGFLQETENRS